MITNSNKNKNYLNRSDPRLRGVVTWLPFGGHFNNFGDVGGVVPQPASSSFAYTPGADQSGLLVTAKQTTRLSSATITPNSMGFQAGKPKTVFFEYYSSQQNAGSVTLFSLGQPSGDNYIAIIKNDNHFVKATTWGNGQDFDLREAGDSVEPMIVRCVWTNLPNNLSMFYVITKTIQSNSWRAIKKNQGNLGGNTLDGVNSGLSLYHNAYDPENSFDGETRLTYLGFVGDLAWNENEASSFLLEPEKLWTQRSFFPAVVSSSGAVSVTAAGATFAGVSSFVPGASTASRLASAAGQTVNSNSSFVSGNVASSALRAGITLSAASNFIAGAASVNAGSTSATVAGYSSPNAASILAGSVTAVVLGTAAGQTLLSATSIAAGASSATRLAIPAGTTHSASSSLLAGSPVVATNPATASVAGVTFAATTFLLAGTAISLGANTTPGQVITANTIILTGGVNAARQVAQTGVVATASASFIAGSTAGLGNISAAGATLSATSSLLAGAASVTGALPQSVAVQGTLFSAAVVFAPGVPGLALNAASNNASGAAFSSVASHLPGQSIAARNGLPAGLIFVNATLFVAGSISKSESYQPREKVKLTLGTRSAISAQLQFA